MDIVMESHVIATVIIEVGEASLLTMGAPGPNMEYGPAGGRPLVHF